MGFHSLRKKLSLNLDFPYSVWTAQIMDSSYGERGRGRGIVQERKKLI